MTKEKVTFRCPHCGNVFQLDKKAVRTEFFLCPVCLSGEIACPETKSENDNQTDILLDEGFWPVLQPVLESVQMS